MKNSVRPIYKTPVFHLLVGTICISLAPIFIKATNIHPDSSAFYRMLFAGVSIGILLRLRRKTFDLNKKQIFILAGGGIFLALDFMCWHRSIHLIGPGISTLLTNLQVFFTATFSYLLFRQRVSRLFVLAVPLALFGLYLITGADFGNLSGHEVRGLAMGLFSALFYSGYILFLHQTMKSSTLDGMSSMLVISLSSSAFLAVAGTFTAASFVIPSLPALWALLGVGILSTTIGWTLISSSLRSIPVTTAGLILLLQPTLAFIWEVLLFAKPVELLETVGVILILLAIYGGSYAKPNEHTEAT
ncbi:MAG: EamA/RhaT family transporter [Desulfuromonas sp.]|nr:MAG: EamA/RhaT family transporter [Desulfuromonas sp.]